jgi:hypothetical protein
MMEGADDLMQEDRRIGVGGWLLAAAGAASVIAALIASFATNAHAQAGAGGPIPNVVGSQYLSTPNNVADKQLVPIRVLPDGTVVVSSGGGASGGTVAINQGTPGTTNGVNIDPTNASTASLTSVSSSSAEATHVFCSAACNLWGIYITTGAAAGFVMTTDTTSAQSNGAITPKHCVQVPANASVSLDYGAGPPSRYATGLSAYFSTTGCFNLTTSATAFFHARVAQ